MLARAAMKYLLCLLVACSSPSDARRDKLSDGYRAQLNDVSIVFPLTGEPGDYLGPDGLLPKALVMKSAEIPEEPLASAGGAPFSFNPLRVLAMRIDPCFARLPGDASQCDNQLRLILQPFGDHSAVDGAIHAFYRLTRAQLLTLTEAIIDARGDMANGPLAVHPKLVAEGMQGPFAQKLNTLMKQYATVDNLFRFTIFTPDAGEISWDFRGFDLAKGVATPMAIPTISGDRVLFTTGFSPMLDGTFSPKTSAPDDMQLLANINTATNASATERQAALDAAFRIENPDLHTPNTIDCASCHMANPARVRNGERELGLPMTNPNAFVSNEDLTQTTPVSEARFSINLHAFSYRGAEVFISQRVINETAAAVTFLNALP